MKQKSPASTFAYLTAFSALISAGSASAATYFQSFNFPDGTTNFGDGSLLTNNDGTASVQSNQLRLTSDTGPAGTATAFYIPALANSSLGFSVVFNFTMIDGDATEGPPADGFSFNYGNMAPAAGQYGAAEAGWGPGSATQYGGVLVDTYLNDAAVGSRPRVGVVQNVGGVGSTLAFTEGNILADGTGASGLAIIVYDPATGFDFTTIGMQNDASFNNIGLPGFTANDTFTFAFSARTGGADQTLLIDNININTIVPEPVSFSLAGALGATLLLRRRR